MYKKSSTGWVKHLDFILLDALCLQIAFLVAYAYRFGFSRLAYRHEEYKTLAVLMFIFGVGVAILFNTMHNVLRRGVMEEFRHTIIQCLLVFVAIIVVLFSSKYSGLVSRIVTYVTIGTYLVLGFATRLLYKGILTEHGFFGKKRGVLLISDKVSAADTIEKINNRPEESININGLILIDGKDKEIAGVPVVSTIDKASEYILNEWVDEVYIAVSDPGKIPVKVIEDCEEMAVTVHQKLSLRNTVKGHTLIERIAKDYVFTTTIYAAKPWQLFLKRIIDIIAGFFMSLAALIVLAIVSPIIRKESPGPILLKHERIGLNGKKFNMYTIRVMYLDADKRYKKWKDKHAEDKPDLASDPRFIGNDNKSGKSGIGVFIRKWSLNVLPKGFNILLGQMSLVGTRAPSVEEWDKYEFRHRARLACKPGLIGLWQTSVRGRELDFEEITAMDTEYITNWSVWLDIKILFRMLKVRY